MQRLVVGTRGDWTDSISAACDHKMVGLLLGVEVLMTPCCLIILANKQCVLGQEGGGWGEVVGWAGQWWIQDCWKEAWGASPNSSRWQFLQLFPTLASIICLGMDGWLDGWMDGWEDHEWMDWWMDGCMGGWMDGWMDGWVDECRQHKMLFKISSRGTQRRKWEKDEQRRRQHFLFFNSTLIWQGCQPLLGWAANNCYAFMPPFCSKPFIFDLQTPNGCTPESAVWPQSAPDNMQALSIEWRRDEIKRLQKGPNLLKVWCSNHKKGSEECSNNRRRTECCLAASDLILWARWLLCSII